LSLAGHHVDTIAEAGALTRALSSRRYDLLLVDAADAGHPAQWKAASPTLIVVPGLYHPTKAQQVVAGQTYKSIPKAPPKANRDLALVKEVLKQRPKASAAQAS